MTYELAKQLKDAGFPQTLATNKFPLFYNKDGEFGNAVIDFNGIDSESAIYVPPLSELVEACDSKDYYFSVGRSAKEGDEQWEAKIEDWGKGYSEPGDEVKEWKTGSTPEEAVAKLWLELNKK